MTNEKLLQVCTDPQAKMEVLTFALEDIGSAKLPEAHNILLKALKHPEAVVREGAIYGCCNLYDGQLPDDMKLMLFDMSKSDPSQAIRSCCKDALE